MSIGAYILWNGRRLKGVKLLNAVHYAFEGINGLFIDNPNQFSIL
jgi:hypothetical protein